MTRYKDLDPILHSQLRLAVISLLAGVETAEFTFLREQTGATAGNLSIQLSKLKEAGYIKIVKKFNKNYPLTLCSITSLGKKKLVEYAEVLKDYLGQS
jgi:DNA-binding transcriptional ArsR family regulator